MSDVSSDPVPQNGERPQPIITTHEDGGQPFTPDLLQRAYLAVVDGVVKVRLATLHGQEPLTWEYDFAQFKERVLLGWHAPVAPEYRPQTSRLQDVTDRALLVELQRRLAAAENGGPT